jgi:acyl carrier protein
MKLRKDAVTEWTGEFDDLLRSHCRFLDAGLPIDPDATLPALGADSLAVVELIVDIEDRLGISLPEELLTPQVFATPGTIWAAIQPLLPAGSARSPS